MSIELYKGKFRDVRCNILSKEHVIEALRQMETALAERDEKIERLISAGNPLAILTSIVVPNDTDVKIMVTEWQMARDGS